MSERKEGSLLGPYRVLDLSDEKGVMCGKVLADLGADVIKVEPPGGDPMRHIGPFYHDTPEPEKSLFWFTFNTSKRGITLDITKGDGRELFKQLAAGADFMIECFPPGYLDEAGLGYSELSRINPRLILTSITPFGQTGPYRDYKGCDLVGMAMGGLMYLIGDPDRPPVRVTAQQAYAQASVQAAAGTMVAHHYRQVSGQGQHVDVSLQEAVSNTLDTTQQAWDLQRMIYKRVGSCRPVGERVSRAVYPCKDGYIACWAPEEPRLLVRWMEAEGMTEEAAQISKYIEVWERVMEGKLSLSQALTQEELQHMQSMRVPFLQARSRRELYKLAMENHFGWAPVHTPKDLVEYPQLATRNYYVQVSHPELGDTLTYPGAPYKLSETPWRIWNRAPLIGEHNSEIYEGELGLSPERLLTLTQANVI